MRIFLFIFFVASLLFSINPSFAQKKNNKVNKQMNVLFIATDDMRTDLQAYGNEVAKTPNLDKLAKAGVLFERAYCQYPLCGPSRASLLTGKKPTTSGLYGNREWFGASFPDWKSLPKYFKEHGYTTWRTGKIFHGGIDDTDAWDEGGEVRQHNNPINTIPPAQVSAVQYYANIWKSPAKLTEGADPDIRSDRWEAVSGDEAINLGDTKVGDRALEFIRRSKKENKPFFLACGFSKPHTPFIAPKEFFDLYNDEDIKLPVNFSSLPVVPIGFPQGATRLRNTDLFINRTASVNEARDYIKAYLACISYVDWNVGRLLDELDKQGLRENTIIVFWSDHGYQLGERGKWSKAGSLWEQGTRVPFIIYDPRADGNGESSSRTVELVDIYPTLVEACSLPMPNDLDGKSLIPLLQNPKAIWDKPAYTVWNEHNKGITGVVIRTEDWRYAEFYGNGSGAFLTDAKNDPHELINLVENPQYKDIVSQLSKLAKEYVEGKSEINN
ncbi:sulfatase [Sphingobacterium bovistauri]|uniref:Sulfatase n=1 Tax=Sphingobacterium bovistauri TaxID=2781959 RepID=A0ABS7Z4B3_9SPHI|nr:sulfatase [Sphingobacterium bovistauri]MCA5003715.1 sulfatase [Sphingobacterium bovistauri]